MDCNPPGSSVHRILQAKILEWVAIAFPENLPNLGIESRSPALQGNSSPSEPPGKPIYYSSVALLSHVRLFATPCTAACQASLSITTSWSLPKLMSIELVMPSNHLILCLPLLLLPSIFSSIRVFSNESVLHIRWPKYWSFSFNISPSNEHPGLISFRMDWLDLLAVQGTLKSLLQHHCSKASILSCSTFFIVQFSHPYMTTGKTIALTRRTFVGKVMSLLFNINVLQGGLQKVIPMSSYSDPRDEILFGKGVFADSIKIRRLGWDRPGLPKSPKFNDTYHYKGQKCWQPDSERRRMHDLETELRDLHPKTRDVWATETWKRHGRTLP